MPKNPKARTIKDRKSILLGHSEMISRPDRLEGGEETEIAAQVSLPEEGGWGWIVVSASFISIFILDGIVFTFGSVLPDIVRDVKETDSMVALINSVAVALYFISGPMVSGFINRFGFRACAMSGSIICSFSYLISYFLKTFSSLCMFYGFVSGIGSCFINMSSGLVVGFYFEKHRSIALAIATCGSSLGVMLFSPLNSFIIKISNWRTLTLLHSGLFGLIYFVSMTFRPLLSLSVVKTTEDPTRTVTYLPSVSAGLILGATPSKVKLESELKPTAAERLFSAVSNSNFPKAADVVLEDENFASSSSQAGPSSIPQISKLTLKANTAQEGIIQRHLKQVQSIMSKTSMQDKAKHKIELTIQVEAPRKRNWLARLFHWESHVPEARPMYRDDAFYKGNLERLPEYQKSKTNTNDEKDTGLNYHLAVSRAAATSDLHERKGVFTTAVRRILATMMDPKLLKKCSFLLLCCSGFFIYLGFLVPYVFLQDRNQKAGVPEQHCAIFISVIGFSNAIGKLVLGGLAAKVNPVKLFSVASTCAGISTLLSSINYNIYFQYGYCFMFGFFISAIACLRSVMLVFLYGLDNLTNATGLMLLFQGLGSLISTPMAGIIKNAFGYDMAFYVAGSFIALSGIVALPVSSLAAKEKRKESRRKTVTLVTER